MASNTRIISTTVPVNLLKDAHYDPNLDFIAPGYYFDLDMLNAGFGKVTVVK